MNSRLTLSPFIFATPFPVNSFFHSLKSSYHSLCDRCSKHASLKINVHSNNFFHRILVNVLNTFVKEKSKAWSTGNITEQTFPLTFLVSEVQKWNSLRDIRLKSFSSKKFVYCKWRSPDFHVNVSFCQNENTKLCSCSSQISKNAAAQSGPGRVHVGIE